MLIGIFAFLLSAIHRLFTAHLYLKQLFIKDTTTFSCLYALYFAFSLFCFYSLSARSRSRYLIFQLAFSGGFALPPSVREVADRRSDGGSKSAFLTITFTLIYEWVAAP